MRGLKKNLDIQADIQTDGLTDIATTSPKRPKGQFDENYVQWAFLRYGLGPKQPRLAILGFRITDVKGMSI